MGMILRPVLTTTFCVFGLVLGLPASAHDAPSGWKYPPLCCGGKDCSPLEAGDLRFTLTADGTPAWLVVETGEVIPTAETRHSPDTMNHRCVYLSGPNAGMTRKQVDLGGQRTWCLWTAEGSF